MTTVAPSRRTRIAARAAVFVAIATFAIPLHAAAAGVFEQTKHARLDEAPAVRRDRVRGACVACHGRAAAERVRGSAFADEACVSCHSGSSASGSYPGPAAYEASAHGLGATRAWPGPVPAPRPSSDAGRCVNCHAPHGAADAAGLVPSLLTLRGEKLCLGCHGPGARTDVATSLAKPNRHPVAIAAAPAGSPARGAGCADCHNPHVVREDAGLSRAPLAPPSLAGVARVRVANGFAGAAAVLSPAPASDRTPALEFEICFRCHSSAAPLPPGSPDLALLLNPANASFHPVEARGRNANVDRRAFVAGWTWDRLVRCSDCHGGDGAEDRGLHGSAWPGLLKRRYTAASAAARPDRDDLCFACHAYEAYVEPVATVATATRFGTHAHHAAQGVGCWSCHETHGSPESPALVARGRGALVAYQQTPAGGTCTSACHVRAPRTVTYGIAYPR